ncbi:hypothetical protein [Polymorphobacter megasporae]|uniref:hypothetical protein n=1 Tax=Glacieibacterium megasporae TaxID=2835787 RepID=UPI001C1E0088|nr:hypothetical protein [Polymorphobacter megasporae]UAJ10887.1 hypothetical protein KTC28_03985 [Polymorphobacter megasporae]
MEPFDTGRGGSDLSGARLDQMRSRAVPVAARPQRAVFAWVLVAALLAFALGLIANPWFERSVRSRLPGFAPTVAPTVADLATLDARIAAIEARPAVVVPNGDAAAIGASGERLARLEGTVATLGATVPAATGRTDKIATDLAALIARIDSGAAATAAALASATTAADRAQAMLVTGAVRRQLTEGTRLGALEPALRRSFGPRSAAAVDAVTVLGSNPVTLPGLRSGLEQLRPALGAAITTVPQSWWDGFRDSLAGVVVRPGTASTGNPARVDRAAAALAAGNVTAAAAEINALPAAQRSKAQSWLAAADRYDAGWRGMAALETLLLDPSPASTLAVN